MLHTEYYKDGTPCECEEMKRFYNCSVGDVMWETPYINGKVHGTERVYYDSGALRSTILYVNDRRHGVQKMFLESGALCEETLWIKSSCRRYPAENFV